MFNRGSNLLRRLGSGLALSWWSLLFLIHLHPFVSSVIHLGRGEVSAGRVGAIIGLAVLLTFFVLKLFNVRFLRLHARREVLVAFWVIAAIIHHNAVATAVELAAEDPAPAVLVSIAAGSGALRHRRIREHLSGLFRRFLRSLADLWIHVRQWQRSMRSTVRGIVSVDGILPFSLRGPPCLCG